MPTIPAELQDSRVTRLTGADETLAVEVVQTDKNRLCVDAKMDGISKGGWQVIDPQECAGYLNITETIYSGPNWQAVFSDTGSGLFFGFHVDSDTDKLMARLTIDTKVIIEIAVKTLKEMKFQLSSGAAMFQNRNVFATDGDDLDFSPCWPIIYRSSLIVEVKRDDGNDVKIKKVFVFRTKEV